MVYYKLGVHCCVINVTYFNLNEISHAKLQYKFRGLYHRVETVTFVIRCFNFLLGNQAISNFSRLFSAFSNCFIVVTIVELRHHVLPAWEIDLS